LIVMTSNLGSDVLVNMDAPIGAGAKKDATLDIEAVRPLVLEAVRRHFRPEFLNRIDEMILFQRLGRAQMNDIVRIQLKGLEKLLADREMTLEISDQALSHLAELGYDPAYGARPLKRVIQKQLIDGIARKILKGELIDHDVIHIDFDGEGLTIAKPTVN
jgi:ATP-dependent Clp protease ATP-binding subunit ClpB